MFLQASHGVVRNSWVSLLGSAETVVYTVRELYHMQTAEQLEKSNSVHSNQSE